jgi:hypothetical protein
MLMGCYIFEWAEDFPVNGTNYFIEVNPDNQGTLILSLSTYYDKYDILFKDANTEENIAETFYNVGDEDLPKVRVNLPSGEYKIFIASADHNDYWYGTDDRFGYKGNYQEFAEPITIKTGETESIMIGVSINNDGSSKSISSF